MNVCSPHCLFGGKAAFIIDEVLLHSVGRRASSPLSTARLVSILCLLRASICNSQCPPHREWGDRTGGIISIQVMELNANLPMTPNLTQSNFVEGTRCTVGLNDLRLAAKDSQCSAEDSHFFFIR